MVTVQLPEDLVAEIDNVSEDRSKFVTEAVRKALHDHSSQHLAEDVARINSKTDPKKSRVFVVVSRQAVIESRFSTVVCAPVYSAFHGLPSQVEVGVDEGLKHPSSVHCDELISLPKSERDLGLGGRDGLLRIHSARQRRSPT